MQFELLTDFLTKLALDQPAYSQDISKLKELINPQQPQVQDPHLVAASLSNKAKPMEFEDQIFRKGMRDIALPNPNKPDTFGKISCFEALKQRIKKASAYIRDVNIASLPADVKKDIARFTDKTTGTVIQYGMCVDELLPKVDKHNFEQATEHSKGYKDKDEFYKKLKSKYILLMNDSIIDGHHFLAKAKAIDCTCSLNVLDLTPTRFQEKKAGMPSFTPKKELNLIEAIKEVQNKGTNAPSYQPLQSWIKNDTGNIQDTVTNNKPSLSLLASISHDPIQVQQELLNGLSSAATNTAALPPKEMLNSLITLKNNDSSKLFPSLDAGFNKYTNGLAPMKLSLNR